MASQSDELLLTVKFLSQGQDRLVQAQSQIANLHQRSVQLQEEQAATATKQTHALEGLGGLLGHIYGRVTLVHSGLLRVVDVVHGLPAILLGIAGGAGSAFGALELLRSAFAEEVHLDQWRAQLETLGGSAGAAEARLHALEHFAQTFAIPLDQVVEASRTLETFGLDGVKYLHTIADVAATTGRDVHDVALAIGEASEGQLIGLRTLGVSGEAILRRAGLSTNAAAVRTAEDNKKIVQALVGYWDETFTGGAERQASTIGGMLTRIGADWKAFEGHVVDAGAGETVKHEVQHILDEIARLERDGTLDRVAHDISGGLSAAVRGIDVAGRSAGKAIAFVDEHRAGLRDAAQDVIALAGALVLLRAAGTAAAAVSALNFAIAAFAGGAATATEAGGYLLGTTNLLTAAVTRLKLAATGLFGGSVGIAIGVAGSAGVAAALLAKHVSELEHSSDNGYFLAYLEGIRQGIPWVNQLAAGFDKAIEARAKFEHLQTRSPGYDPRTELNEEDRRRLAQSEFEATNPFAGHPVQLGAPRQLTAEEKEAIHQREEAARRYYSDAVSRQEAFEHQLAEIGDHGVEDRIKAAHAEGKEKLDLLVRYGTDALAQTAALGAARTELEVGIRERLASRLAAIEASHAPAKLAAQLRHEAQESARADEDALARALQNPATLVEFKKKLDLEYDATKSALDDAREQREAALAIRELQFNRDLYGQSTAAYVAEVERRLAAARRGSETEKELERELLEARVKARELAAQRQVDVVHVEISARGGSETTGQYLAELEARRAQFAFGSDEYIALTAKKAAAEHLYGIQLQENVEKIARLIALGVPGPEALKQVANEPPPAVDDEEKKQRALRGAAIQGRSVIGAHALTTDQAAEVDATEERQIKEIDTIEERTREMLLDSRALWTEYFEHIGMGFVAATTTAQASMALIGGAGKGAYATIETALEKWFRHHQGAHALAGTLAKRMWQEGAAAALDAIAQEMRAEGIQAAARGVRAAAEAFEYPLAAGIYIAASAKYFAAAAAFGVAAAATEAGASSIRSKEQAEENAPPQATGSAARSGERGATQRGLGVITDATNLTQNFNVTILYQGGLNLFGPEAAVALAQELRPVLQDMLNNRELTVPKP